MKIQHKSVVTSNKKLKIFVKQKENISMIIQNYLSKNICMKRRTNIHEEGKIFADKWCLYARQWHHLSFRPTCDHHASIHANSPHHCQRWEGGFSYIQKDEIRMYLFLPNLFCFCNQKEHGRLRALIRAVIHMISVV